MSKLAQAIAELDVALTDVEDNPRNAHLVEVYNQKLDAYRACRGLR